MTEFNKLAIASEFKCESCDLFKSVYLQSKYLDLENIFPENKGFTEKLLEDFKEHIKEKHLNRYKAFIGDLIG